MSTIKSIILGFIAGVIATLTVHELIKMFFYDANIIPFKPWDMAPVDNGPLAGVMPRVANAAFWGGLWGSLFAVMLDNPPQGSMTLRGAVLGILGPAIAGVFLIVPLLKGNPPFLGGDVGGIIAVLSILAGYGAVTAWLYGLFSYGRLP
ncbi:MAG: hypothetical protein ACT4N2_16170 [Hyphomicrobium sp.]